MSGVLLINGSPNKNGCVGAALEEVKKTLNAEGIETEEIHVGSPVYYGSPNGTLLSLTDKGFLKVKKPAVM